MLLLDTNDSFNKKRQTFGATTHFEGFASGGTFTSILEDSGTAAVIDGPGGQLTMVTGATNNDEIYISSTKNLFLIANGKPLKFAARVKYSEASGATAALAFGFMSAVAADAILDGGLLLAASYTGATFFKRNGDTVWSCETSLATTRTGSVQLTKTVALDKVDHTAAGTTFQWLEISLQPIDSTTCRADFFIDGVQVYSTLFTYTSAANMMVFAGVKCGTGAAVTVTLDYLGAEGKL